MDENLNIDGEYYFGDFGEFSIGVDRSSSCFHICFHIFLSVPVLESLSLNSHMVLESGKVSG